MLSVSISILAGKVIEVLVDNKYMNIGSNSYAAGMAASASNMSHSRIQADVTLKVLEQIQDSEEIQAAALVEMIEQTPPSPDGVGDIVDMRV